MSSSHKDSLYYKSGGEGGRNLLLWTATATDGVITDYADNDDVKGELRIEGITGSTNAVFIAIDDVHWTCGNDGFVKGVVRVDNPAESTYTILNGPTVSTRMFFELAD